MELATDGRALNSSYYDHIRISRRLNPPRETPRVKDLGCVKNTLLLVRSTSTVLYLLPIISAAIFSANIYTVDCGCPGGKNGKLLASTTLKPCVP